MKRRLDDIFKKINGLDDNGFLKGEVLPRPGLAW
jgi:hypothetical protein